MVQQSTQHLDRRRLNAELTELHQIKTGFGAHLQEREPVLQAEKAQCLPNCRMFFSIAE